MVWIPLKNGDGQVLKNIKLKAPKGGIVYIDDMEMVLDKPKEYMVIELVLIDINYVYQMDHIQ